MTFKNHNYILDMAYGLESKLTTLTKLTILNKLTTLTKLNTLTRSPGKKFFILETTLMAPSSSFQKKV